MTRKAPKSATILVNAAWTKPAVAIGKGQTHLVITLQTPKVKRSTTRMPLDVAFVIDRSGSMSGQPLELAKRGVAEAIQMLDGNDRFAVIGYDNEIQHLYPFSTADAASKRRVTAQLQEVRSGGSTNLFGGWQAGVWSVSPARWPHYAYGQQSDGRLRRVIVLSDGLANVGDTDPSSITSQVGQWRAAGVSSSTLGLGEHVDDLLLMGMAEAGGGNYAFAGSPADLPGFFARELGEALQVFATGASLTLTLPKGVRAELLDPFPVDRTGKQLTVALGDLPAGINLSLVFAVTTRAKAAQVYPAISLHGSWSSESGSARAIDPFETGTLMAMTEADFAAMPFDDAAFALAADKISAQARRDAMRLFNDGHGDDARQRLYMARQAVAMSPNAAQLSGELDQLSSLNEAAPDFALNRREAMANAHRDARGRER